jgi:hypothetical protein
MYCPKCGTENPDNGKFCRSCGIDLGNVSAAVSGNLVPQTVSPELLSRKGRPISWESAITSTLMGVAFLGVAMALAFSQTGNGWWFWMLIPASTMLGKGLSKVIQLKRYEQENSARMLNMLQNQLPNNQQNINLPPVQQEFIKPASSIYDTGNLVERPPSVTEGTTKLLKIEESE